MLETATIVMLTMQGLVVLERMFKYLGKAKNSSCVMTKQDEDGNVVKKITYKDGVPVKE